MNMRAASAGGNTPGKRPHSCNHRGGKVRVGKYTILAGGTQYLRSADFGKADLLIPLTQWNTVWEFGRRYQVLAAPMKDFGGVPEYWAEFIDHVVGELKQGTKVLAFCVGSHGRTGTFIASLIAVLETADETPDPIAAARERHCTKAVETKAQAESIFALRGQQLPRQYIDEFAR